MPTPLTRPSSDESRPHPRTLGWISTTALALGGSNQSLFLIGSLIAGEGHITGQGSAAVLLLIVGLALAWLATPGWTELVLMWPNRVGGIASCCAEAFRPYSPVLAALTGVSYWWGWVPTCGLTALLSASAIHQWYLPHVPVPALACGLVLFFMAVNLCGVRWVARLAVPIASVSAALALLSALIPLATGHVDWRQATDFRLTLPFSGAFGAVTAAMAGLYLVGFAAPAFEAATCHVGETVAPNRSVPRAVFASGFVATLYFLVLPVIWLGVLGPGPLSGDLARTLGPTFAPLLGETAKAAAIWFMIFNMFHGTMQPLAGAARTLAQLADDGLLPRAFGRRSRTDCPWVTTVLTAVMAILFLLGGDPVWLIAAANLAYLVGIALPNVAVWLLRRDAVGRERPYRAPNWTITAGLGAALVWGLTPLLGLQQFGMPTVLCGLALVFSGAALYGVRRWTDRRQAGPFTARRSLHFKLTGAMLLVTALDGAGYLLAIKHVGGHQTALVAALEDIFVFVALMTLGVGLILPGMVAHAAEEVARAAHRLAAGTLADLSRAMQALGAGDLEAAQARADFSPVVVHSADEMGALAVSFNQMQVEVAEAARGLDRAREGLRQARRDLLDANAQLEARVAERTLALEAANSGLRASEERFRSLVQNATDIITVLDSAGMILYTSPSEQRVLGRRPEAQVGTSLFALMHPDDLQMVQAAFIELLGDPSQTPVVAFRMRHADGSWRSLEAICSNLLDDPSVCGIVVNSRDITERWALEEERERLLAVSEARADREALINRIGAALRVSLDPDQLQPAAMRALGEALGADRCYFMFIDAPCDEVRITHDWRLPGLQALAGTYRLSELEAAAGKLFEATGTYAVTDVRDLGWSPHIVATVEELGLRSAIRVPLLDQGEVVAVLCVAMARAPRQWTADEISLAETIASQTWAAVQTARFHQREHAIADSLQRALLPPIPAEVAGLDVDTYYKAALSESSIGGDFYDVFPLGPDVHALAVGDVSGKGLAAAAQVATVRHMLRSVLYLGLTVAEAVTQLNALLLSQDLLVGFATLFVGIYDARTGVLSYVNCGHEPGLVWRAGSQFVEQLPAGGMALGIHEAERYRESLVALSPGDALVLYTDGLSEAPSADRLLLGVPGLCRLLEENRGQTTAAPLIAAVVEGVTAHAGPHLRDDICILAAVVPNVPAPARSSFDPKLPVLSEADRRLFRMAPAPKSSAGWDSLPEGEERFQRLTEMSDDLAAVVQDGKFVTMNPAGARLLGAASPGRLIGRPLLDVIHPHWRPLAQGRLRLLNPQSAPVDWTEQQWVREDGTGVLVEMAAAVTRHAGAPAVQILARDITDRREIQEQNARLLCEANVSAVRQRQFLSDVLASVTEGRLRLCEGPGDLPARLTPFLDPISLSRSDLGRLRRHARAAADQTGLPEERSQDLESAVGEAAMNAVAHAGGGHGQVCVGAGGVVQVWIQDEGAGISLEHLPQATLERGFTTAGTLGHGFWIMLQTIDRIWLLTGPEGTTLVLEQDRARSAPSWHGLNEEYPVHELLAADHSRLAPEVAGI